MDLADYIGILGFAAPYHTAREVVRLRSFGFSTRSAYGGGMSQTPYCPRS